MQVNEIMTKDVITVNPNTKIVEVAKKMKNANIHAVLVSEEGHLLGIMVDRDLVIRVLAEEKDPKIMEVKYAMSEMPITVNPDMDVLEAGKLMKKHHISRLPVLDEKGNIAGIVSFVDLPSIAQKLD